MPPWSHCLPLRRAVRRSSLAKSSTSLSQAKWLFRCLPGQLLTSDFIGQPVYNGPSDDADNIGTVNDIILGADGTPQAIVIGVGGFLGVGEKDVAIGCNHFSWVDKSGGTRWLMVDADKEQLEKRPFSTAMQLSPPMAHRAPPKNSDNQKTSRVIPEGMKPIANEGLSAEKLIGAMVYDADETKIGTIGDVLMSADGQTEAFVVDVGGFLGINSKPVAISIANLDVATGKDGKLSVFTQFTKKDLQAQPAFSEAAYKEDPEGAILHGAAE